MEISKMFKRFPTLFPPIFKDCSYRLVTNKLTWVLVAILMLPCALGLLVYYEYSDDRISEEIDGEKIYFTSSGELLHEDLRDIFLDLSQFFGIGFIALLLGIMFSSELISEEYNLKTMQILRTSPIHPIEIFTYRYISGLITVIALLGLYSTIFYIIVMMGSGIHGILEEIGLLALVIKILILNWIGFLSIFCAINVYFERPYLICFIYWLFWEQIISGQNYQQLTLTHYINSIIYDSLIEMGWIVTADDYGLVNSNNDTIATDPLLSALIIIIIGILFIFIGSRGIASKQF
ncbi:MAG: ABC transporter permease subunit [Candidatus Poseidoniia archaeon]|nr:ABC transporter permease subunit [Candidatus Poseidoniia archaeon]